MISPRRTGSLLLLLLGAAPLAAQQVAGTHGGVAEAFVVLRDADTVAVERFARAADRLDGELVDLTARTRWNYTVWLAGAAQVSHLETVVRSADAPPNATPLQRTSLVLRGDTLHGRTERRGGVREQRFAVRAGALPHLNLSFALLEQALLRARLLGSDRLELPLYAATGGRAVPARITWRGSDSVVVTLPGTEIRLATDTRGRVLSGRMLSGRGSPRILTVERAVLAPIVPPHGAVPDYSPMPGTRYTAEEVAVPTAAGYTLHGTLTRPYRLRHPAPAVVLVAGSAARDRDGTIAGLPGYRPFRQIADALSRRGMIVLRFDTDRSGAATPDLTGELRAAVAYLRSRPDVDPRRIGLVGHGEGGVAVPIIAASDPQIRAIALLAAPARTGRVVLAYQNRYGVENDPATPAAARDSLIRAGLARLDTLAAGQPWLRFLLDHDPLPTARRVRTPVLILHGASDRQVTPDQAPELAAAFRRGGNRDVTVHVLPEVNHLFLRDAEGNPFAYPALPSTAVEPAALRTLARWLARRLRG